MRVALAKPTGFAAPTTWLSAFSPEYDWSGDEPRYLTDINTIGLATSSGSPTTVLRWRWRMQPVRAFQVASGVSLFCTQCRLECRRTRYLAGMFNGDG
ncbi:hypothetical protein F2981_31515 (plasmid) [Sinorhizobium meliloti]|nr:hypothetical protein [Sinorhizobium meliloti]